MHSIKDAMTHDLKELITHPELPLAHRIRAPRSGQLEGAPCLLLLHGVGANELGLADIAAQANPHLTVILVRSPIRFGPMQFGFFQVSFTQSGPEINADQAEQSRQLLAAFIQGLPNVYGIDAQRIWIAGFSRGGILSASMGLTRPDLVKGFGILSGRILPEIDPQMAPAQQLAGLRAFVSHTVPIKQLLCFSNKCVQASIRVKTMGPISSPEDGKPLRHGIYNREFHRFKTQMIDIEVMLIDFVEVCRGGTRFKAVCPISRAMQGIYI
jgi:phospholipase/carboxylesterase